MLHKAGKKCGRNLTWEQLTLPFRAFHIQIFIKEIHFKHKNKEKAKWILWLINPGNVGLSNYFYVHTRCTHIKLSGISEHWSLKQSSLYRRFTLHANYLFYAMPLRIPKYPHEPSWTMKLQKKYVGVGWFIKSLCNYGSVKPRKFSDTREISYK